MTSVEQGLLMRIQFLAYRIEHSLFSPEEQLRRWADELARTLVELETLRRTQS